MERSAQVPIKIFHPGKGNKDFSSTALIFLFSPRDYCTCQQMPNEWFSHSCWSISLCSRSRYLDSNSRCACVCVCMCVCMCVALGKSLEEMMLNWDPNNKKEASGKIWANNTLGVATKGWSPGREGSGHGEGTDLHANKFPGGWGGVSLHRNSPRPLILRDTQTHPEARKAAHVSHIYVPSQILSPFPNPAI